MPAQSGAAGLWLATQTRRLKFGCAFNVLPMWHPIRLAEDYAMADNVTNGRVVMGVGRGYHTREVESFGAPLLDAEANPEYFEEQIEILLKASTKRHGPPQGQYSIPADGRLPRLSPQGHHPCAAAARPPVEIWQAIASGRLDFMARMASRAW